MTGFFGLSMQSQIYTVTKGGAVLDTFWLYNFGANAIEASRTLIAGDYEII